MVKRIDIGNTDENADWIKSLPGHKDEVAIHEALAKKHGKKATDNLKSATHDGQHTSEL